MSPPAPLSLDDLIPRVRGNPETLVFGPGVASWTPARAVDFSAARLHAEVVRSDPMSRDENRAVRARVRERLGEYREALVRWAPRPTSRPSIGQRASIRFSLLSCGGFAG